MEREPARSGFSNAQSTRLGCWTSHGLAVGAVLPAIYPEVAWFRGHPKTGVSDAEESDTTRPYSREFRARMVRCIRAGRTPQSLVKDFAPSAQTIAKWVKQADLDEGKRDDGLRPISARRSSASVAKSGFCRRSETSQKGSRPGPFRKRAGPRRSVPVRESAPGRAQRPHDVPSPRRVTERILRIGRPPALEARQAPRRPLCKARGRARGIALDVRGTALLAELAADGEHVGKKRVARLMRASGLVGFRRERSSDGPRFGHSPVGGPRAPRLHRERS